MPKARPLKERFQEKVVVRDNGCHEWTGALLCNGYGQIHRDGKTAYAHRVAWELETGQDPADQFILHSCDNRKCVNPAHMRLGNRDDNATDMVDRLRQAHGERNGHAKLTADAVRQIRASGKTQNELAKDFNVCRPLISMIRSRKIWKYV